MKSGNLAKPRCQILQSNLEDEEENLNLVFAARFFDTPAERTK